MTLPNPGYCVSCGAILAQGARYCGSCGQPATAAARRQQSGEVVQLAGREQELAGIGSRFGALVVDGIVNAAVSIPLLLFYSPFSFDVEPDGTLSTPEFSAGWFIFTSLYGLTYSWLWEALGWSPGKALIGIRVRRVDGHRPGPVHGFARMMMKSLGSMVFLLGYLWAFWDDKNQTWHDKAADTYVIKHVVGGYDIAPPPAPWLFGRKALWWALGGTLIWMSFQVANILFMIYLPQWIEDLEAEFEPRERTIATAPLHPQPSEATATLRGAAPPPADYPPVFSSNSTQFPSGSTTIAIRSPGLTSSGPEGTS
jgi:uncharacterized RDD family membrane protein YckC